jgi:type VI secretion system protein ImpK
MCQVARFSRAGYYCSLDPGETRSGREVHAAIGRLHSNRQGVSDANAFRHHMCEALKAAVACATGATYRPDDVEYAGLGTVAFLDESMLNSQNAVFVDWARQPLQAEMFGTQIAGEVFFRTRNSCLAGSSSSIRLCWAAG